jgi:hypothetical protein
VPFDCATVTLPVVAERLLERKQLRRDRREDGVEQRAAERAPEHGLLALQRAAGNRAVARLLQREPEATKTEKKHRYFSPKVAIAPPEDVYEGKCDADLSAPSVHVEGSHGLLGKDRDITFECGHQSFHFHSFRPYFDDSGFPWDIELVKDGTAWVTDDVAAALEAINDDHENAGSKFWNGFHTIRDALKSDIQEYCSD